MRKRNLKSKLILLGLIASVLVIVALIVILVLGKKSLDQSKEQVAMLSEELNNNKQLVYVAARDIEKGEQLTTDIIMEQQIYTGLGADSYMQAENYLATVKKEGEKEEQVFIGPTAIVDIKANEPIMANMVTSVTITHDMRKYEIATAHLMTTQKENDTVDIRIMFPNGEDYLLLAKKTIKNLQMGTSVFTTYMNEDEILRMASAMVDAYTTTGTKIYTVKYVEENIQETGIPNYLVKASILDLINSDPNIIDRAETTLNLRARNDLDRRLAAIPPEQLGAMAEGLGIEDTAKNNVIREGLMNEENEGMEVEETPGETTENTEPSQEQEQNEPETLQYPEETPEIDNEQPAMYDYGNQQSQANTDNPNYITVELN